MITPLEIQKKEFGKGVRGYKEEEVDVFLDTITLDLEKILKENGRLKDEVANLEQENEKYKGSEGEVLKVLEQARQLMVDISVSAEKRAEILLRNAELDAELTVRESRERAERLRDESKNLERRYREFRNKYKQMLENELFRFENLDDDSFPNFSDEKLEELINAPLRVEGKEVKGQRGVETLEQTLFGEKVPVGGEHAMDKTVIVKVRESETK